MSNEAVLRRVLEQAFLAGGESVLMQIETAMLGGLDAVGALAVVRGVLNKQKERVIADVQS